MSFVSDAWQGRSKLWVVFWIYSFLLQIPLAYGAEFLISELSEISHSSAPKLGLIGILLLVIFLLSYIVWIYVAVWRCADNTDWPIFGHLLRIFIAISVIASIYYLAIFLRSLSLSNAGDLLKKDLPTISREMKCKKFMSDYAASKNVDPQKYILDNPDWFNKCIQGGSKEK